MIKRREHSESEQYMPEEEKYRFVREEIRPQRKRIFFDFLQKMAETMILAVVFGVLSGGTFAAIQNRMEGRQAIQEGETTLQNSADVLATQNPANHSGSRNFLEDGVSGDYGAFWQEISDIGEYCSHYIVKVEQAEDGNGLGKSGKTEEIKSGAVFRENKNYYFILVSDRNLSNERSIKVEFSTGEKTVGKIAGRNDALGIAVLQAEKKKISQATRAEIHVASLGGGDALEIGSPIVAVGNPNGVMKSVVSGNVVNDDLTGEVVDGDIALYSSDIEYCEEGSGFMTDMQGRIVGMITHSFLDITGDTDCAFMEVSAIRTLIHSLSRGKEMVYFGVTGCNYASGQDAALPEEQGGGIYVTGVILHSPAYRGKIRVADVITKMDGRPVRNLREMRECLLSHKPGDKIEVAILRPSRKGRSGKRMKVTLRADVS